MCGRCHCDISVQAALALAEALRVHPFLQVLWLQEDSAASEVLLMGNEVEGARGVSERGVLALVEALEGNPGSQLRELGVWETPADAWMCLTAQQARLRCLPQLPEELQKRLNKCLGHERPANVDTLLWEQQEEGEDWLFLDEVAEEEEGGPLSMADMERMMMQCGMMGVSSIEVLPPEEDSDEEEEEEDKTQR